MMGPPPDFPFRIVIVLAIIGVIGALGGISWAIYKFWTHLHWI